METVCSKQKTECRNRKSWW